MILHQEAQQPPNTLKHKCEYRNSCAFFSVNKELCWQRSYVCFTKKSKEAQNENNNK